MTEDIEARLRLLLPPDYHATYETAEPRPMRSAGLVFDPDGRVAWNRMWQTFCDLAIAGGPPHKGRLLQAGVPEDIAARPADYLDVVEEIARGITMASELPADESPDVGWVRVSCHSDVMAGWMLRAITVENVAVRADGRSLDLPASPAFRLEKEIKNVVTVVAKTCHYWMGHMPREQKLAIGELFHALAADSPLLVPDLATEGDGYPGWRAVECSDVSAAIRAMRMLIALNILARREETTLFVPINQQQDPGGTRVTRALSTV